MKTQSLNFCTNLFGNIKPEIQKRLQAVIENPCQDTWDDAYTIILEGRHFKTLWQAVCEVDRTYQGSKDSERKTWDKIPSSEIIIKAIQNTVLKVSLN